MEESANIQIKSDPCARDTNMGNEPVVDIKKEAELLIDDCPTHSDGGEDDYDESRSESSYGSEDLDYEPESKRECFIPSQLESKKIVSIKNHQRVYALYVARLCPMCELEFISAFSWNKHIAFVHNIDKPEHLQFEYKENGAKCKLCDFQTATPRFHNLLEHEISHMPGSHYIKCKLCDWRTKTHHSMNFHLRQQHADKLDVKGGGQDISVCPCCCKEFSTLWLLRKHMIREHNTTIDNKVIFICLQCGEEFSRNTDFRRHVSEKFKDKSTEELGFTKEPGAEIERSTGSEGLFRCTQCPVIFRNIKANRTIVNLREHHMIHLGESMGKHAYKCRYCDQSFRRLDGMQYHVCEELREALKNSVQDAVVTKPPEKKRTRAKERGVRKKRVRRRNRKKAHMKYIRSICLKCGSGYTNQIHCKYHMFKKHGMNEPKGLDFKKMGNQAGVDIYQCTVCEEFTSDFDLDSMLVHARTHTIFDPFQCILCGMNFAYESEILEHHCGNEEFAEQFIVERPQEIWAPLKDMRCICPKCGQEYSSPYTCKRHMHTIHGMHEPSGLGFEKFESDIPGGPATFQCTVCKQFTTTKLDLRAMLEHARQHMPFESFRCTLCEVNFVLKAQALQHKCLNVNSNVDVKQNDNDTEMRAQANRTKLFEDSIIRVCPECGIEFPLLGSWQWHLYKHHQFSGLPGLHMRRTKGDLVECLVCKVQLKYARRREHRFLHLPYKPYKCKWCSTDFYETDKARSHFVECTLRPNEPEGTEGLSVNIVMQDDKEDVKECEKKKAPPQKPPKKMEKKEKSEKSEYSFKNKRVDKIKLSAEIDLMKFIKIICPFCTDAEFVSNSLLTRHFCEVHDSFQKHFTIHTTNAMNCNSCNKYFINSTKRTMIRHYLTEIDTTCFCCRLCDVKTLHLGRINNHILDEHKTYIAAQHKGQNNSSSKARENADPLEVTLVDILKVSSTSMAICTDKTSTLNEFNAYISYACPECNELLSTSEQWHLHINAEHNFFDQDQMNIEAAADGFKRCQTCNVKISGGVLAEQRHKLTHMPYKSFICTLCMHRSNTLGVLTQHIRGRHFAKGKFECGICQRVLSTGFERIEHSKNDHDPSELPSTLCRICYSLLSSNTALKIHMELHNPNRLMYRCKFCDRCYKGNPELKIHVKNKHSDESQPSTSSQAACKSTRSKVKAPPPCDGPLNVLYPEVELKEN